jgi:flavin reductase (DIM6/NTAB) family NADH-FMN oxidoreductase RutF
MGAGVEPEAYKAAMRRLAGAVVMVTTRVGGRPWGLTISSCFSLSLEPPQVLVSLRRATASRASAVESGRFGVSFLRAAHAPLAHLGAEAGSAKFIDGFLEGSGPDDAFVDGALAPALRSPLLAGALHHLDCAVAETFEVADHTLVVGLVEETLAGDDAPGARAGPLVYFERAFHELGEELRSPTSR